MSAPETPGTDPGTREQGRVRRTPGLVAVCALLIAAAIAERTTEPDAAAVYSAPPVRAQPVVAPQGVLSSTWYCGVGTANPEGLATGSVVLANTTDEPRRATVTVFAGEGEPRVATLPVPALGRASLRYADVVTAPFAAARVEIDGGGVAADQVVDGPLGHDVAPCMSGPAEAWEIANGVTAKDATMLLGLLNPFPGDAIVDLRFATEEGPVAPGEFQGVVVPGSSLVVIDVGQHVRRREQVSASIRVRSGRRVSVARLQLFQGGGRSGVAVTPGSSPAPNWYFPDGEVVPGVTERYELYNPSEREAIVELSVVAEGPEIEPFELTIAAGRRLRFATNEQDRIPKDRPHAVAVRSLNDVPVVVEQTVDAVPPAPRMGVVSSSGSQRSAEGWVIPAGGTAADLDEWLVIQNLGQRDATVAITGLAGQRLEIEGLQAIAVGRGKRIAVRITDHIKRADLPLLVRADHPVVVVRSLYRVGRPGIALSPAIPLAWSAREAGR